MKNTKVVHFVEFILIFICVLIGSILLVFPDKEVTTDIIDPYQQESLLSGGWEIAGVGFPDGYDNLLAIQLINSDFENPAFVVLQPRPVNGCNEICSKNFDISLLFNLRSSDDAASRMKIPGIPKSLKKSYNMLVDKIIKNDVYQSRDEVLDQSWDTISINPDKTFWQDLLIPHQDITVVLGYFFCLIALCWILLIIASVQDNKFEIVLLVVITAIALVLRSLGADQAFDSDAPLQRMAYAIKPLLDIITAQTPELNHPPLTFILIKISLFIFGNTEFAARLPFIVAGTISIPAVYLLTKRLSSKTVGLIAALIVTFNPAHADISLMVNDFVLLGLFGLLTTYAYLNYIEKADWKNTLLFSLFAMLTIHCNMLGIIWVIAIFLPFLNKKIRLKKSANLQWKAWIIIAVTALPMLLLIAKALSVSFDMKQQLDMIPELAWGTEPFFELMTYIAIDLIDPPFGIVFALLLIGGFISICLTTIRRRHFAPILSPVVVLTLTLIVLAVISRIRSDYFYFMMVILAPVAAVTITKLTRFRMHIAKESLLRVFAATITALVLMSSLGRTTYIVDNITDPQVEQIEAIVDQLDMEQTGGSITVVIPSNLGTYINYYMCHSLTLWQDRTGKGFHECLPNLQLYTMGMPHTFKGKYPQHIRAEIRKAKVKKPYFLIIGNYASEELYNWANKYCKPYTVEQDFALMKCK